MIKEVVGAVVAGVLILLAGWFSCEQGRSQAALEWQDSVALAQEQAVQRVRQSLLPQVERWQDSAEKYKVQRDSARRRMRVAEEEFESQMDALLADADSVTRPMLLDLREVHVEQVQACEWALNSCESELRFTQKELRGFRDSLVPALDRARRANKALAEEAKNLANPSFLERVRRNLGLLGIGAGIGAVGASIIILAGG